MVILLIFMQWNWKLFASILELLMGGGGGGGLKLKLVK